ncbi:MAG TPA: alpha/beta fold hydrolase [Thermoanaerobaculia bacterium]|nr:alpha/beta fold hydrolase [Thermoanaerobaculia bacterium]
MRRAFLVWAVFSIAWLANSVRTRGVSDEVLRSSATVTVSDTPATLEFSPRATTKSSALIFICGGDVSAHAYAPLLHPLAESGFPVFVVKLPYRFAPADSHKEAAIARAHSVVTSHPDVSRWVISGHSLGGALASRMARSDPARFAAMVLIGTTHPKEIDLSSLTIPVTKVYGSNDGVAPRDRVIANRHLLPPHTRWVEVEGANHSQFGHYGHQLLDGKAAIGREAQQAVTRSALLEALMGDGA